MACCQLKICKYTKNYTAEESFHEQKIPIKKTPPKLPRAAKESFLPAVNKLQ
jgi:hypothetical protein